MHTLPFAELWKNHHPQTLEESFAFWERRAGEFNDITHCKDKQERYGLIAYLEERGALQAGFSVLDLGCGAGRYALEFGTRARHVTGIDISPKMIAYAEENARQAGLGNVVFSAVPWQSVDIDALGWRGAFDLVFASMSPAVDSEETLLKMHAASRAFCFMNGFIRRSDLLLCEVVRRLAPDSDFPPYMGSVIYAFNVLWQHGIYADVVCKDNDWTNDWDIATALAAYAPELRAFLPGREGIERDAEVVLRDLAVDGRLIRRMTSKVAWLFWKV